MSTLWPRALKRVRPSPYRSARVATPCCVEKGVTPNPEPLPFSEVGRPLPFEDVANTPGVTEMALYAWLTTSHPTMPDIVLDKDELRDVVAYILSLKKDRP